MPQPLGRGHIIVVCLLMLIGAVLTFLASRYAGFQWIVNVILMIVGLGQWLLPNIQFRLPQMQTVGVFFARWGYGILIGIMILVMVLNLAALAGYNPLGFLGRPHPVVVNMKVRKETSVNMLSFRTFAL